MDFNSDELPDLSKAALPDLSKAAKKKRPMGDESVARVVDDELSKLGYSENARLSVLGDIGRENNWNRQTIFGGHSDPKNNSYNRGIISWQGDRREKLDNYLKQEGVYGRNDDDELRGMVRFMDNEMRDSPEWKNIHSALRDPNISTYDASENLRKYIKYVPEAPYNSPDDRFRVRNNRIWAEQAENLGLGKLPDLSGARGESDLPDLSQAVLPEKATKQTPESSYLGSIDDLIKNKAPLAKFTNGEGTPNPNAQTTAPTWMTGTTAPKTQIPKEVQASYDIERNQFKLKDTEELRKKYLENYGKFKSGENARGFSDEDILALENTQNLRDGVINKTDAKVSEIPEKTSPVAFKTDDGRIFVEQSDQSGLKPGEVKVRDTTNDKGGVMIVKRVKAADGKESFLFPATTTAPARQVAVNRVQNPKTQTAASSVIQNKIKLSDGAELVKAADQNNLNQGEIRFEGNGETYIVNKDSGDVRDESLSQIQERINLDLIAEIERNRLSPNAAQGILAGQIANVLSKKYNGVVSVENPDGINLSPSDVAAYYDVNGISDWETKQKIDPSRFFANGGQNTDTFYLTRRDVRNVVEFAEKRRALLEDEALKLIASGRELTPREIQSLKNQDITIEGLENKRYYDVQTARTKGEVAKRDFQRFLAQETAQNESPYIARLKAVRRVGWLPKDVVQNELDLYEQTRKEQIEENLKRQELANQITFDQAMMPTGQIPDFTPDQASAEKQADAYLRRLTDTFGSITEMKRREREKELAEAVRKNKVAQMSWGEYLGKSALAVPANITKSALSTAISGTWRGIGLAANTIDDLIDPQNTKAVSDYESYKIAENSDRLLNKYLTVDEALDGEFFTGDLTQGIGSTIGMMFGGASKTPKLAIGLLSTLQMGGDGYREAKQFGATEEQAQMAGLLQAPLGLTEILGMGKAVERLNAGGAGATWRKFFREAWQEGIKKEAPEEILQEGFQTVTGNLIAQVVYDPTRRADQNLAKALLAAGLSSSLVSTGVTLLNTVKNRQQIKRAIDAEQRNGVVVSVIDENNLKVLGNKIEVTPELAPLVESYLNSRNGIADVQNQIEALKEYARNKPFSEQKKVIPQFRDLKNQLNALVRQQQTISIEIAEAAGIKTDENAPVGETIEAVQTPQTSDNQNPLVFHKKLGFVQSHFDQTDVPEGSVKVEIAEGAARGQTRIVPKNEIIGDSSAIAPAQGLSFSNLTPSDGKYAVGQTVEIEGKGKGTIAEIRENGKIIVDYNDGTSRAMFNPKQLKPFVEPEPEGKLKNAQIKQNKREAAARLLGFNLQVEDVVSMPFGADGQTQTGKIVVTKKGEILFKNRILSDEDLARAVFVDRVKKGEEKQTQFTADDFTSNNEENQITDIESASADELIKKIRSGNSATGSGGAIEKFTPEDADEKQTVYTPQNQEVEITPRVVSDDDILTSFDEGYPETRKIIREKVREYAPVFFGERKENTAPSPKKETFNVGDVVLVNGGLSEGTILEIEMPKYGREAGQISYKVKKKSNGDEIVYPANEVKATQNTIPKKTGYAAMMKARKENKSAKNFEQPLLKVASVRTPEDENRQNELKAKVKSELLKDVESSVDGDILKVSLEGGEIFRVISALHSGVSVEDSPLIGGLFLDKNDVQAAVEGVQELISQVQERNVGAETLKKLLSDIVEAAKKNGTIVLNVYDDAVSHEKAHQASYMDSDGVELTDRHARFDELINLKADEENLTIIEKAFNNFFLQYGYSDTSKADKALLIEEIYAYSVTGDYDMIGLSENESVNFLLKWFESYIERNGTKILDKVEEFAYERTKAREIIENARTEKRGDSGSVYSRGGSIQETFAGQSERDEGISSGAKQKERQTVVSAEETGAIEKNAISGDARYYTQKSRNENIKSAQQIIENDGLAKSILNAKEVPAKITPEFTAFQMEVVTLLNKQADEALKIGSKDVATAKLAEAQEIIVKLAENATELGQSISQLASWQKTDPNAVTGYVQKRRAQNGYTKSLTPEESNILRESAQEVARLNEQIAELEKQIAELQTKPKKSLTPVEKIVAKELSQKSESAIQRIKDKFSSGALKTVSARPLLKSLTPQKLDEETLNDLKTVGAEILLLGLKEKPISVDDFKNSLIEMFGERIKPHLREIHFLSVRELKRIKSEAYRKNALKALKEVSGNEDLSIEDLNEILDQKIEARKENAKKRNTHTTQAKNYEKEIDFTESLFKVAATENKEVLLGALYLETEQVATADELTRKLKEVFPALTSREALNTASLSARFRRLAHEDLLTKKADLKKLKKESDNLKKQRNEAQRQLLSRVKYLESPPPTYSERLGRLYQSALVSAVQTSVNNFLTAQATRKIENLAMLGEVLINKTLKTIGDKIGKNLDYDYLNKVGAETRLSDVFNIPDSDNYTVADVVFHFFADSLFARGLANSVLDEFPTMYEAMFGSFASDINVLRDQIGASGVIDKGLQAIEKTYEYANVINSLQEFFIRSQEFNHALQIRIGQRGLNLADVVKSGKISEQITADDLSFAVERALRVTFALKADSTSKFGRLINLYKESTPSIISPFLITFPNFVYNATKFVSDYAPLVGIAKAGYKAAINKDDAFGRSLISEVNPRVISQQLIGTILFFTALGLVRSAGDDDKWYYLKTPFKDKEGKFYYIDVRGYQPFASMIFLANKVNRAMNDKPIFSDDDSWVSETSEALTGLSTRNLTENKILQMGELTLKGFGALSSDEKDWKRLSYVSQQQLGEIVGGFLRPLKTVKDIVSQFDEFEAKIPDTIDRPTSQGIARSLPFANRILSLEPRKDFVTEKESKQVAPILRVFGVNLVNPDTHKEIPSKALVFLREKSPEFSQGRDVLTQREQSIKRDLLKALREDRQNQQQLKNAINKAAQAKILTPDELKRMTKQARLIEIEKLANQSSISDIITAFKIADDSEKNILKLYLKNKIINNPTAITENQKEIITAIFAEK